MTSSLHIRVAGQEHRRALPWIGLVVLALWLGWSLQAMLTLFAPADAADAVDADAIVARLAQHAPDALQVARPTAFIAAGACACDAAAASDTTRAVRDIAGRGVDVRTLDTPLSHAAVVLAPHGRLLYAGPLAMENGCGALSLPRLLPALLSTLRPPLIVSTPCPCARI